jgi:5-methylthioadenosine/S-adenosylhomocysteine deaminase
MIIKAALIVANATGQFYAPGFIRFESSHSGRILDVGPLDQMPVIDGEEILDAGDRWLIPGLIQGHIHFNQTLFRGLAEHLELLPWLEQRIWPLEAAHDDASVFASACETAAELLLTGATAALTLETTRNTDAVFRACDQLGIRAAIGPALMDLRNDHIPQKLSRDAQESLDETIELHNRWMKQSNGRLRACFAPRFVLSCSEKLLIDSAALATRNKMVWHTHASENYGETESVRQITGMDNVAYFDHLDLLNHHAALAHGVWLSPQEIEILAEHQSTIMHCPSTNLKMSSGVADTFSLATKGINIAIGSDGAPANNQLDIWNELRLAGLLTQWKAGPGTVKPDQVFGWATTGGARALGQQDEIGELKKGAFADMIALDPGLFAGSVDVPDDVYTHLVFAASSKDVRDVWVNGKQVVSNRCLVNGDSKEIQREFIARRTEVLKRARLG